MEPDTALLVPAVSYWYLPGQESAQKDGMDVRTSSSIRDTRFSKGCLFLAMRPKPRCSLQPPCLFTRRTFKNQCQVHLASSSMGLQVLRTPDLPRTPAWDSPAPCRSAAERTSGRCRPRPGNGPEFRRCGNGGHEADRIGVGTGGAGQPLALRVGPNNMQYIGIYIYCLTDDFTLGQPALSLGRQGLGYRY